MELGDDEEDSSGEEEVDGASSVSDECGAAKTLKFELKYCGQHHRSDSDNPSSQPADPHRRLHNVKSVKSLMKLVVNPRIIPNYMINGEAVIHNFAKQSKYDHILALLLYSGQPCIDINIADAINGDTPLHIALKRSNADIVKLLIVFGADVLRKNSAGKSALVVAADSMPDMLSTLESAAVQSRTVDGISEIKKGKRMLFLDGGGMRGLLELEVLMEIERRTGRKIIELFDWLVGTSVGGVICLLLVYAEKTLEEIRQILMRLRKVFSSGNILTGAKTRTENLEQLLRAWFGNTRMNSKKSPNVMIFAVHKKTTNVQRHCFNNCFDNEFSTELLWKVARYTTAAAPMYYKELDNYVDGGFLANNPCQAAWTEIHNYLPEGKKLNPTLIVSVGTGIPKHEHIKETCWSNPKQLVDLTTLLVTRNEQTAADFKTERVLDGTPYFRFSPPDIEVKTLETSAQKLVDMMLSTKQYLQQPEQTKKCEQIVQLMIIAK